MKPPPKTVCICKLCGGNNNFACLCDNRLGTLIEYDVVPRGGAKVIAAAKRHVKQQTSLSLGAIFVATRRMLGLKK